jgi:hypothetical protein
MVGTVGAPRVLVPVCGSVPPQPSLLGLLAVIRRHGLPVGRLQPHGPLRPAIAPVLDPDVCRAVEIGRNIELGKVQHPRRPPYFLNIVVAWTLCPWRPAADQTAVAEIEARLLS